jgi:hypothetical protein
MTETRRRVLAGAVLLVLAPLAAGCTGVFAGVTPSASVTTAVQGWEHYFRLDWTAQAGPNGRVIDGYIYNDYGSPTANVQLLAQGLDAGGNVVGQKLEWVPGVVPGLQRSYFRIAALPPAPQYRVSVWSFDVIEAPSEFR